MVELLTAVAELVVEEDVDEDDEEDRMAKWFDVTPVPEDGVEEDEEKDSGDIEDDDEDFRL